MNARKLLKTAAYIKAPKKTFAVLNPGKAALLQAGRWTAERMMPERLRPRRRSSPGKMALKGLGAAAVAVPVGLWIGRRMRQQETAQTTS